MVVDSDDFSGLLSDRFGSDEIGAALSETISPGPEPGFLSFRRVIWKSVNFVELELGL